MQAETQICPYKAMNPLLRVYPFSRNSNDSTNFKTVRSALLALAAALLLAASPAQASNLLVNPDFETPPNGQHVPTGWTRFSPPTSRLDYWVEHLPAVAHSGTYYWKQWNALYNGTNNVAGIYQDFSSAPGSTYQASGWFFTYR